MQIANIPLKWTIPFANGDTGRVEVPATTTDPTRASLTLGFPPLTMQPVEAGGVPPQGEDFNGAMNQVARIIWWKMAGGAFPYDATFATDTNVNGYPKGAVIASADLAGAWLSTADNNTADPDVSGADWVPAYAYGVLALTGQTGGTLTLTPAQAMKSAITVAGALTSNLVIVVPAWTRDWDVTNNTTGAFTVTVKTAAGAGVVIPQNSAPTTITGDGTNITQLAHNLASPTSATQAVLLGQFTGTNQSLTDPGFQRLPGGLIRQWGSVNIGSYTPGAATLNPIVFPIPFPNAIFGASASPRLGISTGIGITTEALTVTGMNLRYINNVAVSGLVVGWEVFGY